jgi:hypothetical protein
MLIGVTVGVSIGVREDTVGGLTVGVSDGVGGVVDVLVWVRVGEAVDVERLHDKPDNIITNIKI